METNFFKQIFRRVTLSSEDIPHPGKLTRKNMFNPKSWRMSWVGGLYHPHFCRISIIFFFSGGGGVDFCQGSSPSHTKVSVFHPLVSLQTVQLSRMKNDQLGWMLGLPPTHDSSHHQDYIFRIGNPELNLHLPLLLGGG